VNPFEEPGSDESRIVREQPDTYLERVRSQTCYRTLRGFINVLAGLAIASGFASLVLVVLVLILQANGPPQSEEPVRRTYSDFYLLTAAASGLFTIVVSIAFRQASSVFVDIADMLIDRNRREWRFGKGDDTK